MSVKSDEELRVIVNDLIEHAKKRLPKGSSKEAQAAFALGFICATQASKERHKEATE